MIEPGSGAKVVLCIGTALGAMAGHGASPGSPLGVEISARAVAPGEPLRVTLQSKIALESAEGRFLDQPFTLYPQIDGALESTTWFGWTMVGLLEQPGQASLEVRALGADGTVLSAVESLEIANKTFPVEKLEVAPAYVKPPPAVQARLEHERDLLAGLYRQRGAPATGAGPFVRPVPGERTSVFGTRREFNGEPRDPHPGLDLRAPSGSPVRSAGPGRVVLARDLYYSGNTILIDHGGGLFTIYAHLSEFRIDEGATVTAGHLIALTGATGRVTGPHLHWGAKIGDRPFDPAALLDPALWDVP